MDILSIESYQKKKKGIGDKYILSHLIRYRRSKSSREHAMGRVFEPVLNVEPEAVSVPLNTSIQIAVQ